VDFKKLPEVTRGQPLTVKEWQTSFDKDGRIIDVEKMKERIFRGGLESNILRRDVWKFLLNYYPWSSTRDERTQLNKQRKSEYLSMKVQWKSMNESQKQRNSSFRDRESLIGKFNTLGRVSEVNNNYELWTLSRVIYKRHYPRSQGVDLISKGKHESKGDSYIHRLSFTTFLSCGVLHYFCFRPYSGVSSEGAIAQGQYKPE